MKKSKLLAVTAYANTLTGLIPDIFQAVDIVSRELTGFIPSVTRNSTAERAAVGEAVTYHIAPPNTTSNVIPAMNTPEPTDQTIGNDSIIITKSKLSEFGYVGEEVKGLNNGPGFVNVQTDQISQCLRVLTNEIEVDIAAAAYLGSSRAYGTASTPFATNTGETAQIRKILDDNGAPSSDRSLVIDTSAGASLRTLSNLTRVNEAGSAMTLRDGQLLDLNGLSIKESAGIQEPTAGTGSSATTDNAGYAIGATTLTLASAGTGTILAGDVITLAGDLNKYIVVTGDADVSGGGNIVIAAPGLRVAITTSATAITVFAKTSRSIAFPRTAIHLVSRAPELVGGSDAAVDRMMITDPRSGLVFEFSIYEGYRKTRYEVALAWGVKAVKTEHIATLLG